MAYNDVLTGLPKRLLFSEPLPAHEFTRVMTGEYAIQMQDEAP